MGSAVYSGHLIIDPSDMSEGSLVKSTGGSGCEALDDSPRPKVLAILAGGRRTEL